MQTDGEPAPPPARSMRLCRGVGTHDVFVMTTLYQTTKDGMMNRYRYPVLAFAVVLAHAVNIQRGDGTAYVSDEGEHCFFESVTILQP